jgi:hypothetical protein
MKLIEELDLRDYRVDTIRKSLVAGSRVTRVFKFEEVKRVRATHKYEVHYIDPRNGFCRTHFSARGRYISGETNK